MPYRCKNLSYLINISDISLQCRCQLDGEGHHLCQMFFLKGLKLSTSLLVLSLVLHHLLNVIINSCSVLLLYKRIAEINGMPSLLLIYNLFSQVLHLLSHKLNILRLASQLTHMFTVVLN